MPPVVPRVPITSPKPKDTTDDMQRKLQQKFAAQRREDMLAMQASSIANTVDSSIANTVENIEHVFKEHSVPERLKQSHKLPQGDEKRTRKSERLKKAKSENVLRSEQAKSEKAKSEKALRLEKAKLEKVLRLEKAKLKKAARGNKAAKQLKPKQIKPEGAAQNDVEGITTSTQPQIAEGSPTTYKASAGKPQETPEAEDKKATDTDSTRCAPGGQTAQKLDDIMDILGSSKELEKPKRPLKTVRRSETFMADTKVKSIVQAMRPSKGKVIDTKSGTVDAMVSKYRNELLARLSGATSKPLDQSKVNFHKSFSDNIEN